MATRTSLLQRLSTTFSSKRTSLRREEKTATAASEDTPIAPSRLSLRILLLFILALALSPILVIGGIRWSGDIQKETERRRVIMTLVAEEAADRARVVLATAPPMLDVIDAVAGHDDCSTQFAAVIDRLPQFSNVAVVDADGVVRCSAMDAATGLSIADQDWFVTLRDTDETLVQSTRYSGSLTQTWTLAVAKRRQDVDGAFAGALLVGVPVTELVFTLDRSGLPQDSEVALVSDSGRVFASRHWTRLPPEIVAQLSVEDEQFLSLTTDQEEARQAVLVPLSSGALYAMLSAPRPAPLALENVSAFANFALPLFAWLVALVTAWLATDRLVLRWLDYLRRIAGIYASGKLTVQPLRARRAAPAEITELADAMQDMAVNVRDRTEHLEAAVQSRDAAMKEIHHRVKNNLQIINSLLSLQSRKVSDPAAVAVLDDARSRIAALSLIHRSLYENNDLQSVEVQGFLGDLVTHLDQALGAEDQNILIKSNIEHDLIKSDYAVPLALFTTEAVTNAVKHAFPSGGGGRVMVSYRVGADEAVLTVEDDGAGGETGSGNTVGLGSTLMSAFARQVQGVLEAGASSAGGRSVGIRMPRHTQPETAGPVGAVAES